MITLFFFHTLFHISFQPQTFPTSCNKKNCSTYASCMFAPIIDIKWHTFTCIERLYLLKSFVLYPPLSCNDFFFVRCFRQGSLSYLIHSISFWLATSNMYIFFIWMVACVSVFSSFLTSFVVNDGTIELKACATQGICVVCKVYVVVCYGTALF